MDSIIITAIIALVACTVVILRALAAPRPIDISAITATEARLLSVREALGEAVKKIHALDKEADDLAYALEGGGMVAEAVEDALKVGFDIEDHFDRYELQTEIESDLKCELGDMVGVAIKEALDHEIKEAIEEAIEASEIPLYNLIETYRADLAPLDRLATIEEAVLTLGLRQRAADRAAAAPNFAPLDRLETIERAFDALLNQRAAERAVTRATVSPSH
jgi:hypothetical protein